MDTERTYWIALGISGLAFLLDGAIRATANGLTIPNGGTMIGATLVLIGGFRGCRSSESLHHVPSPLRYLVIFGAVLSVASIILRYLF